MWAHFKFTVHLISIVINSEHERRAVESLFLFRCLFSAIRLKKIKGQVTPIISGHDHFNGYFRRRAVFNHLNFSLCPLLFVMERFIGRNTLINVPVWKRVASDAVKQFNFLGVRNKFHAACGKLKGNSNISFSRLEKKKELVFH